MIKQPLCATHKNAQLELCPICMINEMSRLAILEAIEKRRELA